jgi:superoxide dismutase, Cu-Zn family
MPRALCILAILLLASCASAPPKPAPPPQPPAPAMAITGTAQLAIANLASASGTLVSGRVELRPAAGGVRVTGVVGGLTRNGAHGLQVHERGDCSAVDARSAGNYFDPTGARGVGGSSDRIVADPDGVARVDLLLRGAVLGGGAPNDIAGRALIVLGATSGASSARVACGAITVQPQQR